MEKLSQPKLEELHEYYTNYYHVLNKSDITDALKCQMREVAEEIVFRHTYRNARIQYRIMDITGDFGAAGQDKISEDFCRLLLNKSPWEKINLHDLNIFHRKLLQDNRRDVENLTIEQLIDAIENPGLLLMGRTIRKGLGHVFNQVFNSLDSKKIWFCSYRNGIRHFMVGDGKLINFKEYTIHYFETEDMRSPFLHLDVLSDKSGNNIMIRKCNMDKLKVSGDSSAAELLDVLAG